MRCPKCSYERQSVDQALPGVCPKCGIVYAKFVAPKPVEAEPAKETAPAIKPRISPRPVVTAPTPEILVQKESALDKLKGLPHWVFALGLGLFAGYFIGREHIKYELRSAIAGVAENVRRNMSGETDSKPNDVPIFSAILRKKTFQDADFPKVQAAVLMEISFDNLTGKDVRAFDGTLVFTDLLDNPIIPIGIKINDPVGAGQSYTWEGGLEYNQFKSQHKAIRSAEIGNIKMRFDVKKVLFADGTIQEY